MTMNGNYPPNRPPPADTQAGPPRVQHHDQITPRRDGPSTSVDGMPADRVLAAVEAVDYGPFAAGTAAFVRGLRRCLAVQARSKELVTVAVQGAQPTLMAEATQARRAQRQRVSIDLEGDAIGQAIIQRAQSSLAERVADELRADAEAAAAEAVSAALALQRDLELARASLPFANAATTPAQLAVREGLAREIEVRGVSAVAALYTAARAVGDDARCIDLEEAATPYLQRVVREPEHAMPDRRKLTAPAPAELTAARRQALALLRDFDVAREARTPATLRAAEEAVRLLLRVFKVVVGYTAQTAPPNNLGIVVGAPLTQAPTWWTRTTPNAPGYLQAPRVGPSALPFRGGAR